MADPLKRTADELQDLLTAGLTAGLPFLPELEHARAQPEALRDSPQAGFVLSQTEHLAEALEPIPQTSYTRYRQFVRNGDRKRYETPYFDKRATLATLALRLFLGDTNLKDSVQDRLWDICEESNWVVPAHEDRIIDLFAAETGFVLAETLCLLGDTLDAEVRHRVRVEIERRIFDPYLRFHRSMDWYYGTNNWNGVCNSSVAATFLLLEPEVGRAARALELAFRGLEVFLANAFEEDGSSTEGVAYWHYGLINFVALAEMLRARTGGALDLLASERLKRIAAYPAKMQLSGPYFASFSDCDEAVSFNPGIVARLAERTGEASLHNLLARPVVKGDWRLTMMLRNLFWWDGTQPDAADVEDVVLPSGGIVKLVARTPTGERVLLPAKAGHNAEHHNQNDVGSFMLHVAGENLLTDPGRGLYNRDYFGPKRYENVFANSYGHSVPRIGGKLQQAGREFRGELLEVHTEGAEKRVVLEMAGAYPLANLESAKRRLTLQAEGEAAGTVHLQDTFRFSSDPAEVEEALITWHDVEVEGNTALIRVQRHVLRLTIEEPAGGAFKLERLEEACQANVKEGILTRLSFVLPVDVEALARVRMELTPTA